MNSRLIFKEGKDPNISRAILAYCNSASDIQRENERFVSLDFEKINLNKGNFSKFKFFEMKFTSSMLWDACFDGADIVGSWFSEVKAQNITFEKGAQLTGVSFHKSNLPNASFSSAYVFNTTLSMCNLANSDFSYTKFGKTDFAFSTLLGCNFLGASLGFISFDYADISACDFTKDTSAVEVDFSKCIFDVSQPPKVPSSVLLSKHMGFSQTSEGRTFVKSDHSMSGKNVDAWLAEKQKAEKQKGWHLSYASPFWVSDENE